ncbi:hypothetical protein BCR44DRAFT_1447554 [Catenaria anguillulae PL171]|uniref:Uncharacterized protein n=1 Tax=Catenaria anguillulae PL171 TaxID=765915 RepID=A0A1Y2H793_9FUNG|nr:hypothetical protein BCR44DRAFT_1447554 [Catenaria anguillulae PL171]
MERYLPRLLSGELAVTPTIEVWQVALRFCKATLRRLAQALDGNPDNKTLLDLVTLYGNYIEVINKKILDLSQSERRYVFNGSKPDGIKPGLLTSIAVGLPVSWVALGVAGAIGATVGVKNMMGKSKET